MVLCLPLSRQRVQPVDDDVQQHQRPVQAGTSNDVNVPENDIGIVNSTGGEQQPCTSSLSNPIIKTMRIQLDNTPFPHFDHKYKCCCNAVHVKQGSLMIALISLIMLIFAFIGQMFNREEELSLQLVQIFLLVLEMMTIVALLYGLHLEREKFLIPFMLAQVISILFLLGSIGTAIWAILVPNSYAATLLEEELMLSTNHNRSIPGPDNGNDPTRVSDVNLVKFSALFGIITFSIAGLLTLWWLVVVYRCYRYLRELNFERGKHANAIHFNARVEM